MSGFELNKQDNANLMWHVQLDENNGFPILFTSRETSSDSWKEHSEVIS